MSQKPKPSESDLSTSQRSLLAIRQLRAQLDEAEARRRQPIAIVGLSCRFPGGADTPERFWQLLEQGIDTVRPVPEDRWDAEALYDREPGRAGRTITREGGFLDRIDGFDADFFGIAAAEAEKLDPQQRLLLEVSWTALEDAGQAPDRLSGSKTGVFVGLANQDYLQLQRQGGDLEAIDVYSGTGCMASLAAGRLSHLLGLRGPSMALDTACSSSLLAVHLACQSLRQGECDLALAGGANLILTPESSIYFSTVGALSPDGRCKTFDAAADGYGRGEGCGVVVLKRLDDARRDGDRVLAVVRGSAVNHDGRSSGLTVPNGTAQRHVLRDAYENAGVDPETVAYVEAHGTGTPLGDPIEVEALAAVLGRRREDPLWIGSVKTNLGHLEAAAGIAGLIKAVLVLQQRTIPPHLHFKHPNEQIAWSRLPVQVPQEARPLPRVAQHPSRVGVSAFALNGTNVHVVLEDAVLEDAVLEDVVLEEAVLKEAAVQAGGDSAREPAGPHLLTLSAKSATALETLSDRLAEHLDQHPALTLSDVAYTLHSGRATFEHRRMLMASDLSSAAQALRERDPRQLLSAGPVTGERDVAFLFPGLGEHYRAMGRRLYDEETVFRATVDRCCDILRPLLDVDPLATLFSDSLDRTSLAHPLLFTIEYALAQWWLEHGVRPRALIGYSLGEYVAACVAGVMSLEDALRLVARRAQLIEEQAEPGAMMALPLESTDATSLVDELTSRGLRLSIAAYNGPSVTVVAGAPEAIDHCQAELEKRSLTGVRLRTSHAFHSVLLAELAEPFADLVADLELAPPRLPLLANVTGTWMSPEQATDPQYWAAHLRQPVRFSESIDTLRRDGEAVLVEVGPGRSLTSLALQQISSPNWSAVASLPGPLEKRDEVGLLRESLGRLWLSGCRLDLARHLESMPARPRRVALPTYPFEPRRYWLADPQSTGLESIFRQPRLEPQHWLRVPVWHQTSPPDPRRAVEPASWLIFADTHRLAEEIQCQLDKTGGHRVLLVSPGKTYTELNENHVQIDPGRREDYDRLIQAWRSTDSADRSLPRRVLHLWSFAFVRFGGELAVCDQARKQGFDSVLLLGQALDEHLDEKIDLTLVTNNTQAVIGDEVRCPEQALVWGLGPSLPKENQRLHCRVVDLDLTAEFRPCRLARALLAEVGEVEEAIALRGRHRFVRAHDEVRNQPTEPADDLLRKRGVYLITGGLGGLGLALAEDLARRFQARLILVGRTALPAREKWPELIARRSEGGDTKRLQSLLRRVLQLERLGGEVMLAAADVADEASMRQVVDEARERFGGLHGVIHAAGVPGAGLMALKTPADAAAVLRPKVRGTLVLDRVLAGEPLDFLALFSSVIGQLGGVGEADYAAANAFLDAFAHQRGERAPGRTLAIDWCPWRYDAWQNALLAALPDLRQAVERLRQGYGLSFAEGIDAFYRALGSEVPQVVVSTLDWDAFSTWAKGLHLDAVSGATQVSERPKNARPAHLQQAFVAPSTSLEIRLAELWQKALGIESIGIHDSFFDLGGNSLVGTQLIATWNRTAAPDQRLAVARLFEAPTIHALARLLDGGEETAPTITARDERGRRRRQRVRRRRPERVAV